MEKSFRIELYACTVPPMKISENVLKVIHIRGCKVRGKATWYEKIYSVYTGIKGADCKKTSSHKFPR